MSCGDISRSAIVDTHYVIFTSARISDNIAIKQYCWDSCLIKHARHHLIYLILTDIGFKRSKKNPRRPVRNQSKANITGFLFSGFGPGKRFPPHQHVILDLLCRDHALANWLENLRLTQLWNHESKRVLFGAIGLYIRPRPRSPLNISFNLQFP